MANRGENLTSPRRLGAAERQRQALTLRRAGASLEEIARQVGYRSASGAYHAIRSGLRKTLQEPADEVRQLELDRLDRLTLAVWPAATAGDLAAIDRVLKLMARRAELLGLDVPKEVRHAGPGGGPIRHEHKAIADMTDEELRDIANRGGIGTGETGPGPAGTPPA